MDGVRGRVGRARRSSATVALGLALALAVPAAARAQGGDPYRPQQWNIERIGAPAAWTATEGTGQVIAVVDSGVDLQHPDLVDQILRDGGGRVIGRDFVDDDGTPQDELGHGTMVAGIAAATRANGEGIVGTAPRARIMPVRVLDAEGRGTSADVDAGIRWAVDNGATIVNLSLESATPLGGSLLSETGVAAPVAAVEYAWERGVVVVAAAGNSGNPFTDYPQSSPIVLVGATDRSDERAGFSDTGRSDLLMAPGVEIVSTWCDVATDTGACNPAPEHRYGIADGTSFAAPHVAGAVALLRATGLSPSDTIDRLRRTARDIGPSGRDEETGYGLLDVEAATGTSPPPSTPTPTPTSSPSSPSPVPSPAVSGSPSPAPSPSSPSPTPASPSPSSPPSSPAGSSSPDDATATASSPSPSPGSPAPSVSPSPTSPVATPAPTPSSDPAVATGPGPDPARGPWPWVAVAIVALTAAVVARGVPRRS